MEQPNHRHAEFFALPIVGFALPFRPIRPFAHSPVRPFARSPSAPLALYTPALSRQISCFMEVDFQAIKLEELKSRLGELRRYL